MKLKKGCASENGMALISVILIVMVGSLIFTAFATAAYTNVMASQAFMDAQRTKYIAETGVEIIVKEISSDVSEAQKAANEELLADINATILANPNTYRDVGTGNIKMDQVNTYKTTAYETKYIPKFNDQMDTKYDVIDDAKNNYSEYSDQEKALIVEWLGNDKYGAFSDQSGILTLKSEDGKIEGDFTLDKISYIKESEKRYIEITIKASLNDGRANIFEKIARAKLMLLPDESYKVLPYTGVYKTLETPEMFKKPAALVAQGNISFKGSTPTKIDGNVICFGTIPNDGSSENMTADMDAYGGIVLGDKFGKVNVNITGNAATMSYFKCMDPESNIVIGNNVFARTFLLDQSAYNSKVAVNGSLYTTDDLQIESEESYVKIVQDYYGMVMNYTDIAARGILSAEDETTEQERDMQLAKRTSSIIINGLSTLELDGEINIGGTTFAKNITTNSNGTGLMYPTGYAAMKTSGLAIDAFTTINRADAKVYDSDGNPQDPVLSGYYLNGSGTRVGDSINMFTGYSGLTSSFNMAKRAQHIIGMWNNVWKDNEEMKESLNVDKIIIKNSEGLKGYAQGVIMASLTKDNSSTFDRGAHFFGGGLSGAFRDSTISTWIPEYQNAVLDFIRGDTGIPGSPKLSQFKPSKELRSYVDSDSTGFFSVNNIIAKTKNYAVNVNGKDMNILYSPESCTVKTNVGDNTKVDIYLDSDPLAAKYTINNQGIVFTTGNITINNGVKYKGLIIATGNIVVNDGVEINRNEVNGDLQNLITNDMTFRKFFRLLTYDTNESAMKSQRINTNTCRVVEWHENRSW